ncbi:TOMM system kinase/cyclase fusion protein [Sorangium sp. So ce1335]|uniref:TOMM system kinase/cyclase fusion protein n=1 Tax=Sorangium sp. So ce1335 TaxID=3133335 RepID=UPI003F5DA72B
MSSRGDERPKRDAPFRSQGFQGRYEILSRIGAGGFGTVFQGRQVATGQRVAIKILKPGAREGSASKRVARFQREMRLCARLHHTNIVGLIDSGQTSDGQIYLVFEFVPGKNLREVLREEGALEPQEARHLMLQVLDALSAAHAQGITHRDLKPSNLMIMPTGARRNALVLDFGIGAIAEDVGPAGEANLTGDDEVLGTPAYAAPEQLQGGTATPRADLFAWGLVFLECLTGRPVFSGRRVAEVVSRQLDPEPIAVPAALLRHPVGRLLSRALVKKVEERDVTAEGLLRELEACDLRDLPRGLRGSEQAPGAAACPGPRAATAADRRGGPPSPARPSSEGAGERRLLTAVCCSLQTSAAAREGADVEDRDELLRAQQEVCFDVARRFQGTVVGALGERVLLCFGHPVAGEDDAERASRAALEIAATIGELGQRREVWRRLGPQVRIGAHTGLVIVPEGGEASAGGPGPFAGTTASVAAHLSGLAPPGAVLLSGDTCRLLRDRFVTEALGARELGGAGRVEVHRIARERSALEPRVAALPMIGRTQELALLTQRWRRVREGFGQGVLVTGQPGIGKSRLAAELYREIRGEAHFWIECRCAPENRSSALRPMTEALEQVADIDERHTPEEKAARLRALLVAYGFRLADTMPLLASLLAIPIPPGDDPTPLDLAPQRRKELTLGALVSLLIEMAERRPVLFLLEDLQWADPTTLELLTRLLPEVAAARVCVLLTARPDFSPPWPLAGTLQIQLSALESAQVAALIAGIAAGKELPPRAVQRVIEQAEGVPLFVEELTRAAIESGASAEERAERGPSIERSSGEVSIPTPLRVSLMARLDRLGRARETAQLAAVLGREFSGEVLAEISALDEAAVREDLDRLIAADILLLRRRARQSTYVFRHVLLRDAAYASLPRRARQRAHARVARALEERFPQIAAERPGLLAMHHARAEQMREAIAYGRAAARRALGRSMNAEAVEAAFQTISWLGALDEPRERAEAELDLHQITIAAVASIRSFAAEEVDSAVRRAQELIERVGDRSHALAMLWARFNHHWKRGNAEQAYALAQQYAALSERSGDAQHTIAAHVALGRSHLVAARYGEAEAALGRAVALYDPERHRGAALVFGVDLAVSAQVALAAVSWSTGHLERSAAWLRSAEAAAGALDDVGTTCHLLVHAAMVHHGRRDRDAVRRAARRLIGLAEPLGLTQWLTLGGLLRAWIARDVEGGNRLLADMSAAGMGQPYPRWSSLVAESEMDLGRFEAALARLDRCLAAAGVVRERRYVPEIHRLRGDCLRCLGDERAAERSYREAVELARAQGARSPELRASLHLARLLDREGRHGEVHDALTRALRGFPEGQGWCELAAAEAMVRDAAGKLAAA